MSHTHDVLIVGTGAAGVSAATPLVEAGLDVLLLDPGVPPAVEVPEGDYWAERAGSRAQHAWMVGPPGSAEHGDRDVSPKFRAPTLRHVYEGFAEAHRLTTENFFAVGSLAPGGLTAAWGSGVAAFDAEDLAGFPVSAADLAPHYARVAVRIGCSAPEGDDLGDYLGLGGLTMPPLPMDSFGEGLERRYRRSRERLRRDGFRLGRPRLAVLTRDHAGRSACDLRGLCLWGCPRRAIYSAAHDLEALRRRGVGHHSGVLVERIERGDGVWRALGTDRVTGAPASFSGRRLVLAAGVLATTRLVLELTGAREQSLRLLSTPTTAFAVLWPRLLGRALTRGTALAQHNFLLEGEGRDRDLFGGVFPATTLPASELVLRAPLSTPAAADFVRAAAPGLGIGAAFFAGEQSDHRIRLTAEGALHVKGGFAATLEPLRHSGARRLRAAFRQMGGLVMPGSFVMGAPGSDVHYAGTLPMRSQPGPLETSVSGELAGAPGLYVADPSVLPVLPPKPHTMTAMALADRLGARIAADVRRERDRLDA